MARKKSGGQVYVATEDGHALIDGVEYAFHRGRTRVSEDSVLRKMKAFDTFFEPADEHLHYADAEQATAAPGETRDVMLGEQVGPLEAQTVAELRETAKSRGVTPSTMNKAELVAAIEAADATPDDEDEEAEGE
jgi:hypothetical protein